MIPKNSILKGLFIDIETAAAYETFAELQETNPKLAELWSKRCEWLRTSSGKDLEDAGSDVLWSKKASLHPEFAIVVCVVIGAYNGDELKTLKIVGDEHTILTKVNTVFNNGVAKNLKLAGHNIRNFDIPFLGKRMLINRINPSEMINFFNKKPWEVQIMDSKEIFSFGYSGMGHVSLDLMCTVLGVESPKGEMDGSQVHEAFYRGKIATIADYCERDVLSVVECFNKMSF